MLQLCTITISRATGGKKYLRDDVRNHTRKIEIEYFHAISKSVNCYWLSNIIVDEFKKLLWVNQLQWMWIY